MTSNIEIEKGIPLPTSTGKGNHKYPWAKMMVGDSFFVPTDKVENFRRNVYARNRDGRSFVCKFVDDGVRVWRTA